MQEFIKKIVVIIITISIAFQLCGCQKSIKEIEHNFDNNMSISVKVKTLSMDDYILLDNNLSQKITRAFCEMPMRENPLDSDKIGGPDSLSVVFSSGEKEYIFCGQPEFNTFSYYDGKDWKWVSCDFYNDFFDIISEEVQPFSFVFASKNEDEIFRFEMYPLYCYYNESLKTEASYDAINQKIKAANINVEDYLFNVYLCEENVSVIELMNQLDVESNDDSIANKKLIELFVNADGSINYYNSIEINGVSLKTRKMMCCCDLYDNQDSMEERNIIVAKLLYK